MKPFGFPKKAAYIAAFEHGTDVLLTLMEEEVMFYLTNGRYSDKPVAVEPTFFSQTDWVD